MSGYRIIEGCCGTAALSYHLCGFTKPILSYQGSKWRFRKELAKIIQSRGFSNQPEIVELYDPGPWSKVIPIVSLKREQVLDHLIKFSKHDPKVIYDSLQGSHPSKDESLFAAEFLFLQRLSFSGKAVGCSNGIWSSPGFNSACAYGLKGTDKFGEVKPMIPSLIKTLESFKNHSMPKIISGSTLPKPNGVIDQTVVYLDPPYVNSTKYPDGHLDRKELVSMAQEWAQAGALVLVSEAEPISELKDWTTVCISKSREIESSFKSKKEEWVTVSL